MILQLMMLLFILQNNILLKMILDGSIDLIPSFCRFFISQRNTIQRLNVMALFTFNEKSKPTNDQKKYAALARMVKGKALPDYTCAMLLHIDMPLLSQDKIVWL